MVRKLWIFLGTFLLLMGMELVWTHSVVLNSRCTELLAKNNVEVQRKRWWVEALTGNPLEYPEKEIEIRSMSGYILLGASGLCFMHGLFLVKDPKKK